MMHHIATMVCTAALAAGLVEHPATSPPMGRGAVDLLPPAHEINPPAESSATKTIVITHAALIDGRGGPPIPDAVVVVRGGHILAAGARESVDIPANAEIVDAAGQSVLPGLIDVHFHLDGDVTLPGLYLQRGVTSLRDPGAWIEAYDPVRTLTKPNPRLFLTGPHLDAPPAAHPQDSLIVRDPEEARLAVNRLADQGASAIKIYFRLPIGTIQAITEAAHARGLVTTAHLEIVDAGDAIRVGVDGIEHVTSFGVALSPLREAETFRQGVLANNAYRNAGRYALWSNIDLNAARADAILDLLVAKGTFFTPTLAVFEARPGDAGSNEADARGFSKMLEFVGRAHAAGVRMVVGSHSDVPHAERGGAYMREMELMHEAGMSPSEIIVAGTLEAARFLRVQDRLGTIEPGKIADLILVGGDPLKDLSAMRDVRRVMLDGVWVR